MFHRFHLLFPWFLIICWSTWVLGSFWSSFSALSYQRRFLHVNIDSFFAAFIEIHTIWTLLHRSNVKKWRFSKIRQFLRDFATFRWILEHLLVGGILNFEWSAKFLSSLKRKKKLDRKFSERDLRNFVANSKSKWTLNICSKKKKRTIAEIWHLHENDCVELEHAAKWA